MGVPGKLRALLLGVMALLPWGAAAQVGSGGVPALGAEVIVALAGHGPWPQPVEPAPSNRVSGSPEAIALGRRLFFDARLSPSGRVACSSCHRPERAWTDGRPRGKGLAEGRRNTPSLLDVRLSRWLGWGGGGDSLWAQSLRPLLDPDEMGANAAHVRSHVLADPTLATLYGASMGRAAAATAAEDVLVDAAKALAAYQETLTAGRSVFDDLRDALIADDASAAQRVPAAAVRGLALFVGPAGCARCHSGPAFTDGRFHAVAAPVRGPGSDEGRRADVLRMLASPYNLRGRFNDDAGRRAHWSAEELREDRALAQAFRTPTLRNVARTAPYLHDGSAPTLAAAIRAHDAGARLDRGQIGELVAFLALLDAR